MGVAVTPFFASIPKMTVHRSCLEAFKLHIPEEKPCRARNAYTTIMGYWSTYFADNVSTFYDLL